MSKLQKRNDRVKLQRAEGGNTHHCCVPSCTAGGRFNKTLSFHSFPKDPELRTQWSIKIRRDRFRVTPSSRVCSRHFETGEIVLSSSGKRCLQPKVVPSLFHWNDFTKKSERPGVWERRPRPVDTVAMATEDDYTEDENNEDPIAVCAESPPASIPMIEDHDYAASPLIVVDRNKYESMSREMEELRQQSESYHSTRGFGSQRFATSPDDIRYYTRFPSYEHSMAFWNLIEEATHKMVRVTSSQKSLSTSTSTESPVNRPTKLLPIDELFSFLNYSATGCTQGELCHKFNIHRATSEVFSAYKSHCTFKALIGMSPHGASTFVSALFEGSISDKEIFCHSGITSLLTSEMDVMVDKGFSVDELVPGKVHRPAFLSKQAQMSEVDVLRTQSIARSRVHVERLIRRVKENKLFDTVIPLSISGSINQIFTVACLLTNYQYGPSVKKWVID